MRVTVVYRRLLQQEYITRCESYDDLEDIVDKDSNLFQRKGVIAAFPDLESALA